MSDISDILTTLVTGYGAAYFIIDLPIAVACGLLWLAVRRRVHTAVSRRLVLSLLFAVAFAPSIFGFDLGAVPVPALFVIALASTGGLRFIALCWSVASIVGVWATIFGAWSLISMYHVRSKHDAA